MVCGIWSKGCAGTVLQELADEDPGEYILNGTVSMCCW